MTTAFTPVDEDTPNDRPSVEELLDVDREYRDGATAGSLPTIAPRKLNPLHESWLPVLHTARGTRNYTALFSNTATAHRLNRTHDWVVIYWEGRNGEKQCTVVTEFRGPLAHRRVVRGREKECLAWYSPNATEPRRAISYRRSARPTAPMSAHPSSARR